MDIVKPVFITLNKNTKYTPWNQLCHFEWRYLVYFVTENNHSITLKSRYFCWDYYIYTHLSNIQYYAECQFKNQHMHSSDELLISNTEMESCWIIPVFENQCSKSAVEICRISLLPQISTKCFAPLKTSDGSAGFAGFQPCPFSGGQWSGFLWLFQHFRSSVPCEHILAVQVDYTEQKLFRY